MRDLRKRIKWASSHNLTMANLFENLARVYGDSRALDVGSPLVCKYMPDGCMADGCITHAQALHFTNLAAEALIDGMNLVKGERVLLMTADAGEGFLLAAAVIKAGGIVIPVLGAKDDGELAYLVSSCGVNAALVQAPLLDGYPRLQEAMKKKVRLMALQAVPQAGKDIPTLSAAMEKASGFFLPYTLKLGNVVLLCAVESGNGPMRAVMVTNRGLLSPARLLSLLLPVRVGDLCLVCNPPESPSLFAAALLALVAGMRLRFSFPSVDGDLRGVVREERPAAVLGDARGLRILAERYSPEQRHALPKLWLSAGLLGEEGRELLRRLWRQGVDGGEHWLVETFTAGENATIAGLRISRTGRRHVLLPCVTLPPNRIRFMREDGNPAARGEEGELAIRGPAVNPGYWNDLEATFRNWREGWLYTGLRGTRSSWGGPRGSGA